MAQNSSVLPEKAALYLRVSTQFQVDKDSLHVQRRELAAYSELVLGIKNFEVFEDPGYSGKNTDRPAFQKMMSRLRSGEFSHLLVWKIDRISRNLLDFAEMYAELKRIGVTFVSKNEQFDTSTAIGEAMLKIILVFAELERQMTAERVTAVMLSRANNGQWNGGRVPFGYSWDKETNTFSINPREAEVYNMALDLYEDQRSLLAACKALNDKGYTSREGNKWSPVTLRNMFRRVFYLGTYRYNVHTGGKGSDKRNPSEWIDIPNHHPPMISEDRFNRIEALLKRNRRTEMKPGDTIDVKNIHIFAGLILCGNCGSNMTSTPGRRHADGWRPTTYGCSKRRKVKDGCPNKFVTDPVVAPFIFSVLSSILSMRGKDKTITAEAIEKKMLRHRSLSSVSHIKGLERIAEFISQGKTGMEYVSMEPKVSDEAIQELHSLHVAKGKNEAALRRLQSLYLYGDGGLSEKDYLIERKAILATLEEIEHKLANIDVIESKLSDDDFVEKASYFVIIDKLLEFKDNKAEKVIRSSDPLILRSFMRRMIHFITVTDGLITKIQLKNGVTLTFIRNKETVES